MTQKRKAIVLGSGGHSRVVLSILYACQNHNIKGIIDLQEHTRNEHILKIPVIGSIKDLDKYIGESRLDIFLAIGDNSLRQSWWAKLIDLGFNMPNLISPNATLDPNSTIGEANVFCSGSFVGPESSLGNNNLVNTSAVIEHEVKIGSHCHIAPSSTIAGRSTLSNNCFIGAGAVVIDGIEVAEDVSIGAGSTVVKSIIKSGRIYVGTPAKPLLTKDRRPSPRDQ